MNGFCYFLCHSAAKERIKFGFKNFFSIFFWKKILSCDWQTWQRLLLTVVLGLLVPDGMCCLLLDRLEEGTFLLTPYYIYCRNTLMDSSFKVLRIICMTNILIIERYLLILHPKSESGRILFSLAGRPEGNDRRIITIK